MRMLQTGEWGRVGLTLSILCSVMISGHPTRVDARAAGPPSFSDGNWKAKFSVHSVATLDVTTLEAVYGGDMDIISSGGELDGQWTLNGIGVYLGDISGDAIFTGSGKIGGSSADPKISTSTFVVHVDIVVSGTAISQSVDMGSGGGMSLTLVSATCNQVTADIVTPAMSGYQSAGAAATVTGSFVAIRVGDLLAGDATNYMSEVADLLADAEDLKQKAINEKGVDFEILNNLVTKAENLSLALKQNLDCGQGGEKQFLTIITDVISDLAYFALQNPHLFTTQELSRLAFVALQVGALGSGSANPQQAAELKAKFVQEFDDRLNDALSNKSCNEATQILVSAGALGDPALKQYANEVVAAVC